MVVILGSDVVQARSRGRLELSGVRGGCHCTQIKHLLTPGVDLGEGLKLRDGSCLILEQNCPKAAAPELLNNNAAH